MLSDCDGARFRRWAGERARAWESGAISADEFLRQFGKSADTLVAELVDLIKNQPRRAGRSASDRHRFELDRVLQELEAAVDEPAV